MPGASDGNKPIKPVVMATPQRHRSSRRASPPGLLASVGGQIRPVCAARRRVRGARSRRPARTVAPSPSSMSADWRVVNRARSSTSFGPGRVGGEPTPSLSVRHPAWPCAAGMPAQQSSGPACSSSWSWWWKLSIEPTPRRSTNRRQALGANTTSHSSTTRTSRITIALPDDLPSLRLKTLVKGLFQLVDGGEMRSADLVGTSPLYSVCTLLPTSPADQGPPLAPCSPVSRRHSVGATPPPPVGAADGDATSKHADTRSEVMTSCSGPDARTSPSRPGPPWVKPRRDLLAVVRDEDHRRGSRDQRPGTEPEDADVPAHPGRARPPARRAGATRVRS